MAIGECVRSPFVDGGMKICSVCVCGSTLVVGCMRVKKFSCWDTCACGCEVLRGLGYGLEMLSGNHSVDMWV